MGCGGSKDGPTATAAAGPALAALKDLTSGSPNCTPIPEADAVAALKILNLSGCKLGPEGGAALRDALPSMAGLEILALSDTTLGLEGVKNLSAGLKSKAPPNLTKLLLRNSFEDDAGCIAVCGALTKGKAKALQTLDLGGTGLSNEGVSALIKMCAHPPVTADTVTAWTAWHRAAALGGCAHLPCAHLICGPVQSKTRSARLRLADLKPPLSELMVADTRLGGAGVKALVDGIQKVGLTTLASVDFFCVQARAFCVDGVQL